MQFLNPIWFFALAAISIPVVIHLWNIRPGKTLKVGSISLISEASKSTRRSFKLLDILSLILRCLLLGLLALLLTAPVLQRYQSAKKAKGWLLIPKKNLRESYKKFKPAVDSLIRAGYEFHYFNNGFAKQELNKILADTALKDTLLPANYWTLAKQLDSQIGNALPVSIFTPNSISNYQGDKPSVKLNLKWQTYTPADSVKNWIARAALTNNGTIKVTRGNSSPAGTYYTDEILQNGGNRDITLSIQNGQPFVSLKGANEPAIAVDTGTLRIAIYTDKFTVDAGYLKAALLAAVNFSGHKAIVKQYNSPAQIPGGQAWLFWLSEQPVTGRLLKPGTNIFKYESGKAVNSSTWIKPGNIVLTKRINIKDDNEAIWRDGFGKPVLSLEKQQANIYHFYSRFNPIWNDLVWSDDFAKMILKLVAEKPYSQPKGYERRILTNRQIQPQIVAQSMPQTSISTNEQTDISKYFWLLLLLVFCAERILSHKVKQTSNG